MFSKAMWHPRSPGGPRKVWKAPISSAFLGNSKRVCVCSGRRHVKPSHPLEHETYSTASRPLGEYLTNNFMMPTPSASTGTAWCMLDERRQSRSQSLRPAGHLCRFFAFLPPYW